MYGLAAVPIVTPLSNATVVAPPSSTAYSEIKQGGQRGLQSQQFAQHIQQAQHVQHAQAQYTQRTQYEQHAQRAKRDRIQACMKTIIKCMRCVAKLDPAREMPPAVDRAIMRHVVKHVEQLQAEKSNVLHQDIVRHASVIVAEFAELDEHGVDIQSLLRA